MTEQFRPAGRMVDIDGHRLHVLCEGEGRPSVILEMGMPGIPSGWSVIQPEIAKFTRVCSYDRAGIGWSDPGPEPRSGKQIITELHTLLHRIEVEPPYILVGLSFGGHYIRLFTAEYPEEVAGLVFVDSSHEDMVAHYPPPMARLFRMTKYMNRVLLMLARLGIVRALGARLPLFSALFHEKMPDEQRREILWHMGRAEQWRGTVAETNVYDSTEAEVRAARVRQPTFGDLPIAVITAGATFDDPKLLPPGVKPGEVGPIWLELQKDLASLSTNSTQTVLDNLTHIDLLGPDGIAPIVAAVQWVTRQHEGNLARS